MTNEEWVKVILSNGAIGALVGATALWLFNKTLAQKARKADFVREQIKNLYGPVTFLLEKGERAFEVHNKLMAGYEEYFKTRYGEHYSGETTLVIGIANEFGELAKDGAREAAGILKDSWGWLDADDGDAVRDFLTYFDRLKIEFDSDGKARLPFEFYHSLKNSLRPPLIHDSNLVKRFRQKLLTKQAGLSGLKQPKASPNAPGGSATEPHRQQ